jgi:AsmA protein
MKWFKRLLLAVLLVVVFLVLAMIGVVTLVDPNDYRDEITTVVMQQTGRELVIEGDIHLSVFPWLGLELGAAHLANPPGFTDKVFAGVERANIKVALLPLLHMETRIGKLELKGLKVNLERRADGQTNWADLMAATGSSTPPQAATPPAGAPPVAQDKPAADKPLVPQYYIGGLDISDTDISWRDAVNKMYTRIEDLKFTTGEILPLKSIPFKLDFGIRNDSPKILAGATLKGAVRVDLASAEYALENLNLKFEASGMMVPAGSQTLLLQLPLLTVKPEAQTAEVQQLKMQLGNLNLGLDLHAASIMGDNPQFNGRLTADIVQLRSFLQSIGIDAPVTTDPTALAFLNAQLAFKGDSTFFETQNLKVTFDETNITGSLAVNNLKAPSYRMDLNFDKLNADRYLPPSEVPHVPVADETAGTKGDMEIPLPVEDLRKLKAEGNLKFGKLQLMKLKLANLQASLKSAGDGIVRLDPLSVDLYSGNFQGAVIVDVTGETPQYKVTTDVSKVQIEPLLFDFMGSRFISGQMNAKFDISTQGRRLSQFKKNLSGTGDLKFRDGALSMDLREKAREAKAKLKREAYKAPPLKPTNFSAITAGLNINEGTVSNNDLEVRAGHILIKGAGEYALPKEAIDYTLTVLFSEDPNDQDGALKDYYDVPIDLHLKGKLAKLDYLDVVMSGLTSAAKGRAKKEIEEKTDAAKDKARDDFRDKLKKKLGL